MKNLILTTILILTCTFAYAQTPKYIVYIHIPAQIPSTLQNYITVEKPFVWYISEVPADNYKSVTGWIVFYLGEEETGRFVRDNVIGWRRIINDPELEPIPPSPDCVPEWCSLPIQDCSLPPLTGGTDSCGQPCSKPSPEFPNCKAADGTVIQKDFGP